MTHSDTSPELKDLQTGADSFVDFGEKLIAAMLRAVPAPQAFFYHFVFGNMEIADRNIRGFQVGAKDFIERTVAFKPPLSPATLAQYGSGVYRAGEIMQWHVEEMNQWSENYRLIASAGGGWGLTCLFMEGEVLLGVAGISRPMDCGEFKKEDLLNLRALFPYFQAGFRQTCLRERRRLLGSQAAAALERHPDCLFVFSEEGELLFANFEARRLMQNERPGVSDLPMGLRSQVASALGKAGHEGKIAHAAVTSVKTKRIISWGAEKRPAILYIVNAKSDVRQPLSPRQRELVECVSQVGDFSEAAAALGISLSTLRTHLRNIYRRMGASNLDEVIAKLYFSSSFHD